MKKKLLLIVLTFLIWTVIFTLQKPFFLIFYGGFSQVFNVVRHGLKLDLSTAAYLTAIPSIILLISSIPIKCLSGAKAGKLLMDIVRLWFCISSFLVAVAFVANLALYGYWNFP